MNKIVDKIDGLVFSLGITAGIVGITYFSKLYYFFLSGIPLTLLSFSSDDFTKFSIIPIILVCVLVAFIFYTRFSLGKVVSTNNWIANSLIELILWILLLIPSIFFSKIDIYIFQVLDTVCSILLWIHGASFLYSILMGHNKKAKTYYANALALKAEAEFLKEENERIINNTNIPSGSGLTVEERKKLHKDRVEAIKRRFIIEDSLEKTSGMVAEIFFDFGNLSKYAKYLTIFFVILSLNCKLIKKEISKFPNRFISKFEIVSDKKDLNGIQSVIYFDSSYIIIKEAENIQIYNNDDIKYFKISLNKPSVK